MANPSTIKSIMDIRQDMSDYLFHFTRGKNCLETLNKIVSDKQLLSKNYICFTEAPLQMLPDMFDFFGRYPTPLFCPYGIAVKKQQLYEFGARPIWYAEQETINSLPEQFRWRCELFDLQNNIDYSWQREWRINKSELDFSKLDFYLITKTDEELESLQDFDIDVDGEPADGGYETIYNITLFRTYKGIAIQTLKEFLNDKRMFNEYLAKQKIGETIGGYSLVNGIKISYTSYYSNNM